MKYDFSSVEKKWQDKWDESGVFHAKNDSDKPSFFGLVEFPYPSAQGLHVGHPRSYTALDIICHKTMFYIRSAGTHLVSRPKTLR